MFKIADKRVDNIIHEIEKCNKQIQDSHNHYEKIRDRIEAKSDALKKRAWAKHTAEVKRLQMLIKHIRTNFLASLKPVDNGNNIEGNGD